MKDNYIYNSDTQFMEEETLGPDEIKQTNPLDSLPKMYYTQNGEAEYWVRLNDVKEIIRKYSLYINEGD